MGITIGITIHAIFTDIAMQMIEIISCIIHLNKSITDEQNPYYAPLSITFVWKQPNIHKIKVQLCWYIEKYFYFRIWFA